MAHQPVKRCSTSLVMKESESEIAQSCSILCHPVDCSPPGSSVHGISQARILEWAAIPSPGDLPNSGIDLPCPALAGGSLTTEQATREYHVMLMASAQRVRHNLVTEQ